VLALPISYKGACTMVINNWDPHITLRNIIILLMATLLDASEAVDAIVHLWYSAAVDTNTLNVVQKIGQYIRHFIDVPEFMSEDANTVGSIEFGRIHISLLASQWLWILKWFDRIHEYSNEKAQHQRKHLLTEGSERDFLQNYYYKLELYHRVAFSHYYKTGVLIPLASSTQHFTHANP
jgi:hypothetical protein